MKSWKTKKLKNLADILISLKNQTDMLSFLRDLCTLEELEEMSKRWEAVTLIEKGIPYREIAKQTDLSTTTITRIAHWLHHGEKGYNAALKNTKK